MLTVDAVEGEFLQEICNCFEDMDSPEFVGPSLQVGLRCGCEICANRSWKTSSALPVFSLIHKIHYENTCIVINYRVGMNIMNNQPPGNLTKSGTATCFRWIAISHVMAACFIHIPHLLPGEDTSPANKPR